MRRTCLVLAFVGGIMFASIPYNPIPAWAVGLTGGLLCFFASWLSKGSNQIK